MKSQFSLNRVGLAALVSAALAVTSWGGNEVTKKKEMRVLVESDGTSKVHEWVHADGDMMTFKSHHDDEVDEGPSTFLGVETTRVGSTLGAQLGLGRGLGLVVARVVPDTGAADALEKHDLLLKFEDQLLVTPDQLGVLVKSKEPGTEVALTILRGGEEQVVSVTLSERKSRTHTIKTGLFEEADLQKLRGQLSGAGRSLFVTSEGDDTATIRVMNINRGSVVYSDEKGTVRLISGNGPKRLVVIDADDNEVFDGPVETDEQRAQLEAAVKERLEKVESLEAMDMGDGDIEIESNVRVLVPHASHGGEVKHLVIKD